ncbi:hypothetical protein [Streptomyces sp. NPDC002526]
MAGRHTQLPAAAWQHTFASALADLASRDERILDIRIHGSASDCAKVLDQWSDLDMLITTREPFAVAEDIAREIAEHHAPVFAASWSGDANRYTVRFVLSDLRRLDLTFEDATRRGADRATPPPPSDVRSLIDPLVNDFRFDAVLAACKAARRDVLIGAHLTLGLARHVLVAAMILRDQSTGTTHH